MDINGLHISSRIVDITDEDISRLKGMSRNDDEIVVAVHTQALKQITTIETETTYGWRFHAHVAAQRGDGERMAWEMYADMPWIEMSIDTANALWAAIVADCMNASIMKLDSHD